MSSCELQNSKFPHIPPAPRYPLLRALARILRKKRIMRKRASDVRNAKMNKPLRVILLAAGKGTRMRSEQPKALLPFRGKPMIQSLLQSIKQSGVDDRPVIVVGYDADAIRAVAGEHYDYVLQAEQLGTGHAVAVTESLLRGNADAVLVLYVDHPLIRSATIKKIADAHRTNGAVITMATITVPNFAKPYDAFAQFGRIIRAANGALERIAEIDDATPTELAIRECNSGVYCFNAEWLFAHLPLVQKNNVKKEFFLTDCIALATKEKAPIDMVAIDDPRELVGVNTLEQLRDAEQWKDL